MSRRPEHRNAPDHHGEELRAPSRVLAQANVQLAASLDLEDALASLASLVVPAIADGYAVDLVSADGELRRVAFRHHGREALDRAHQAAARDPVGGGGVDRVVRTGRPELVTRIDDAFLRALASDEAQLARLRELGVASYAIVPLIARGRILGAMTFVYAGSGRHYDEEALGFVEDLAARAALALDNIRLIGQLNEALERAEEEHREKAALLASTADGIYGLDREGRCTFMNEAGARLLGLDAEQTLGRTMHPLIHHTRRDGRPYPRDECPITRTMRDGESVRVGDEVLWRSDGSSFPASYSASPVIRDGEVVGAVVAFADDSLRRAAEEDVQLLGRILDESLNEIYVFDADTLRLVQVNRGGRENLGYSMEELRQMTPVELKPEFTLATFQALLEPLRSGEKPALRFETLHRRRDGSTYPVEVNLQRSHGGERPLFVAVILDITARRKAEEERERLIHELREANQVKVDFVSTMSHELRTPLNAVLGYAQLLEDGVPEPLPEGARAQVRRINLSGRHLLQLIDEILTFSKLEAGRERPTPAPVHLRELVDEVRAVLQPIAEEKGLRFTTRVDAAPERFISDPSKLRQILLNLAGNAIKFTREGTVGVTLRGEDGGVAFEVTDTGVGMTAQEQTRAFEPFWQADQSSTREVGGTGLGLALTRRFVDVLGGTLELASTPGAGTTVTVTVPPLTGPDVLPGTGDHSPA